jgi:hypothetical protein
MSNIIPSHMQSYFNSYVSIFLFVDNVLQSWVGEGCYKLPLLLEQVSDQFQWNEEQFRAKDPVVRDYLRNHEHYYVTRGAHGGVGRRTDLDKKEAVLRNKKQAKDDIMSAIEADLLRKQNNQ